MPLPYKPAADSRHRRACFALYRALVRQGLRIPLPHDVLEGNRQIPRHLAPRSSYFVSRKDGNPIPALITHAFRRNRKLDSTRLICLALKNGYRFLDLFAQAKSQAPPPSSTSSPSLGFRFVGAMYKAFALSTPPKLLEQPLDPSRPVYNSIIEFLRQNQARVSKYLLDRESSKKPNPFRPHPDHVPLLTLLPPTEENPGPVYVPTVRPRPLAQLSGGVRKLPTLDDCTSYPFLRLSKPQSPVLSVMILSNARSRQKRLKRYHAMQEEDIEVAKLEDEWDALVERMAETAEFVRVNFGRRTSVDWARFIAKAEDRRDILVPVQSEEEGDIDWAEIEEISYADSWRISVEELGARLTRQHELWVARGRALWGIVEAERALAEKEAQERGRRTYKRPVNPQYLDKVRQWNKAWERKQLKAREEKIRMLVEKEDWEGAEKLRNSKFRVQHPRRMGFKKRDMVGVVHQ